MTIEDLGFDAKELEIYNGYSKEDIYSRFMQERNIRVSKSLELKRAKEHIAFMELEERTLKLQKQLILDIFDDGMDYEWLYSLTHGTTNYYFDNEAILSWWFDGGTCYIFSASVNERTFKKSILRDIRSLMDIYNDIVIDSDVKTIENFLKRNGFSYNSAECSYIRNEES